MSGVSVMIVVVISLNSCSNSQLKSSSGAVALSSSSSNSASEDESPTHPQSLKVSDYGFSRYFEIVKCPASDSSLIIHGAFID